jgi:ParB-like chromosome segregation protein Spo0J
VIRFHPALADLMVPAQSLFPNPENANNGDVDEIVASILTNGCYRPVYATGDGEIVAGHHLYAALLELGAVMVPVMYVEADESGARRIMLADNRIAALAKTDDALLLQLLQMVSHEDKGLTGTGFDERYLAALRDKVMADVTAPLEYDLRGSEDLVHTITCPACGHHWSRAHTEG